MLYIYVLHISGCLLVVNFLVGLEVLRFRRESNLGSGIMGLQISVDISLFVSYIS